MKKKKKVLLILLPALLLFACTSETKMVVDKNGIIEKRLENGEPLTTLDDLTIKITSEEIIQRLSAGEGMLLYIGNDYCSSCVALKPNLIEYIQEKTPLIFHFDNLDQLTTYPLLLDAFPHVFRVQIQTPSFYFIERGATLFHYQNPTPEFLEYRTFEALMDYRLQVSPSIRFQEESNLDWTLIKAFNQESAYGEKITFLYNEFNRLAKDLDWVIHGDWTETMFPSLSNEESYLVAKRLEEYDIYPIGDFSIQELSEFIQ